MSEEIKYILENIRYSAENPRIIVPDYYGEDEEISNDVCLDPDDCSNLLKYIDYLKKSLENAQDVYKNSHKYTSECEDKVIELKSVLKEIRELVESYNLGKYDYSIPPIGINDLLKIIDKGIGE